VKKTREEKEKELSAAGWSRSPHTSTCDESWYRENFTLEEATEVEGEEGDDGMGEGEG